MQLVSTALVAPDGGLNPAHLTPGTQQQLPPGVILPYAGSSAPSGWLLCYGQAVSRTTYAALFAIIGTTYGSGDGNTTFNVPDARGRVLAGKDNMGGSTAGRLTSGGAGLDGTVLGTAGGTETHTLTTAQIPSHTHSLGATSTSAVGAGAGNGVWNNGSGLNTGTNSGGGGAHPNVQPTLVVNKIIKT